jgi:hypothetical protein
MATRTLPPLGSVFKTGESCQVSGVYSCVSCTSVGRANEIPLSLGETFPPCRKCSAGVRWKLIRYA